MLSLETCLKLKEAGWEQTEKDYDSSSMQFRWARYGTDWSICSVDDIAWRDDDFSSLPNESIACPTLEELLIAICELDGDVELGWAFQQWWCALSRFDDMAQSSRHDDICEAVVPIWLKLKREQNV